VATWLRDTFVTEGSPLYNEDHKHLAFAAIGVLWTNVANSGQQRTVLATAEMPTPKGARWTIARAKYQLAQWFGDVPDFVITLSAPLLSDVDDATFCAVLEHELYHCSQARNEFGAPKWHLDGSPVFGIRGHDVEEFVSIVARYGAGATRVGALVQAAQQRPLVQAASIVGACGTCIARAA
jgi:hypothetical protein